jgi:nicotinate-nucleotide adenylyltransferase
MNIGLYFGSFNPVHTGHLIIANHVLHHTPLEQVWFVVSPQNPLKPANGLLNEYHRLHLVKLAIEGEPNLKASDIEFTLPRPSYTIDTLTYLSEKYPQHKFSVIMGSDSLQNLPRWKNFAQLLQQYELYVYRRPGFDTAPPANATVKMLDAPLLDISATRVRECVKNGRSIRYLVPDAVKEEIEKCGYYK